MTSAGGAALRGALDRRGLSALLRHVRAPGDMVHRIAGASACLRDEVEQGGQQTAGVPADFARRANDSTWSRTI